MAARASSLLIIILLSSSAGSAAAQDVPSLTIGYEQRVDRFTYRFENPSNFSTPELVPHFFRQHYEGDNRWLLLHAAYGRHGRSRTAFGITPVITTLGDDYDTFFQPDGDVVVSGTTGDVSMRSWRLDQRVDINTHGAARLYVEYGFRRDRSVFHDGYKTVTHTRPPSLDASIVTTRETTTSDVHVLRVGVDITRKYRDWTVQWAGAAEPGTFAVLTVQLPDKYPGRDIRFVAPGVGGSATVSIEHGLGPLAITLEASAGGTRSYRDDSAFDRRAASVALHAIWRPTP